jgi:threonyl-tRNA synthetase
MYNLKLWKTSGHYKNYKNNIYLFKVESQGFGMKPMNCPGHCLMFDSTIRSYRELPLRMADFGVLHRNEISGALSGFTRVRRFCQDDAHIFCAPEHIMQEVLGCLNFLDYVYGIFGFKFELELSTRPEDKLGDDALWDQAEGALAEALNKFGKPWKENPGDGAFYGPKIDIKVYDALKRPHQCGTVQLDF